MKSIRRIASVTLLILFGIGGFVLHDASRPKALSAMTAAECSEDYEGSLCTIRTWCFGIFPTQWCFSTNITYYPELDEG